MRLALDVACVRWHSRPDIKAHNTNHHPEKLSEADLEQVRVVLHTLEAAQLLIDEARSQLCSVVGFWDQWSHLAKTHDTVKLIFYS